LADEFKELSGEELPELTEAGKLDVEILKQERAQEKERAEAYLTSLQRVKADFDNYKKRVEQERHDQVGWANAELIKKLLPVLDDLDRAFAGLPHKAKEANWVEGFKLIHRKLLSVLEAEGVVEVECVGEQFDPNIHDAVMQREGEEGVVLDKVCKGYKLKDRWLRAPQVVVGNGTEAPLRGVAEDIKSE
jgi:molecular chaperone GrpE